MDIQSQIAQLELKNDPESHFQLGKIYFEWSLEIFDCQKAIHHFEIAAEAGLAKALYQLGYIYTTACGVKIDYGLARKYFELATNKNYGAAYLKLGELYEDGHGVVKNESYANELYLKAKECLEQECEQGNLYSMCFLGLMYQEGHGVEVDNDKAIELLQKAADLDCSDAYIYLGNMCLLGSGLDKDPIMAQEYFEKAIELNNLFGQLILATVPCLYKTSKIDINQSIEILEKASKLNIAVSLNGLGIIYEKGIGVAKDQSKAIAIYKQSADLGDTEALIYLGEVFLHSSNEDVNEAKDFFQDAANLGNVEALTKLAKLYLKGKDIEQNISKAFELYQKAHDLGDLESTIMLSCMYSDGIGVKQDTNKGHALLKEAESKVDPFVFADVGFMYYSGEGLEQNYKKALLFFKKAFNLGVFGIGTKIGTMYYLGEGVSRNYDIALDYCLKSIRTQNQMLAIVEPRLNLKDPFFYTLNCCGNFYKSQDLEEAFYALRSSKYQELHEVSFELGLMYRFGLGTTTNLDKAQQLLTFAASNKHHEAMVALARLFDEQHAPSLAFYWYTQAFEHRNFMSWVALGIANWLGIFSKKDQQHAFDLIESASQNKFVLSWFNLNHNTNQSNALYDSIDQSKSALGVFTLALIALDEYNDLNQIDYDLAIKHFKNAAYLVKSSLNHYVDYCDFDFLAPANIESWTLYAQILKSTSQDPAIQIDTLPEISKLQELVQDVDSSDGALAKYLLGSFYQTQEEYRSQGIALLENLTQQSLPSNAYLSIAAAFKLGCFYEKQAQELQEKTSQQEDVSPLLQAIKYFKLAAQPQDLPCFDLRNIYHIKALLKLMEYTSNGEVTSESLHLYEQALATCLTEPAFKLAQWYQRQGSDFLDKAISAYQVAAQGGIAQAQYALAQIYNTEPAYIDHAQAKKLYESALEQGIDEAAMPLGEIYEHGLSCTVDLNKAFELYLKAANAGIAEAQYRVGERYLIGTGTDSNAQKALSWLEQAASQNHPQALYALGKLYEEGAHVTLDLDKATKFYQKATDQGYAEAANALAKHKLASSNTSDTQALLQQLLDSGDHEAVISFHMEHLSKALLNQDENAVASAISGLKDLADQGILSAQVALAQYYESLAMTEATEQALVYHKLAAEQGHVPSFLTVAKAALNSQDHDAAFKWLSKLSDAARQSVNKLPQGYEDVTTAQETATQNEETPDKIGFTIHPYSAEQWAKDIAETYLLLAQCYEQGLGTATNIKLAFDLYSKAENAGLIEARFSLALILLNGGDGIKPDERQAVTLLNKLVKRKFAPAQLELGKLYLNGQGVKVDQKQAFTLIKAAADQKLPEAMAKLSELYAKGTGTPANPKQSQAYLKKAQALGWKG